MVEPFWLELMVVVVDAWFTVCTRAHGALTVVEQAGVKGVELAA